MLVSLGPGSSAMGVDGMTDRFHVFGGRDEGIDVGGDSGDVERVAARICELSIYVFEFAPHDELRNAIGFRRPVGDEVRAGMEFAKTLTGEFARMLSNVVEQPAQTDCILCAIHVAVDQH